MNRLKKTVSILLAVMMVLSVCGGAFAETIPEREVYSGNCGAQGDNLTWTFYTIDGVLSIKGSGNMANWSTASSVPWYSYAASVKVLLLYSGVTSIGRNAFNGCRQLASATIPSNVTRISASAFYGCTSLASVTIGGSVTNIADHAFYGCTSLTSIEIPESVTSIGASAFEGCGSLASASFLGAPPTSFGSGVFDNCAPGFTIIYAEEHAAQWSPNGETEWNGYPIAPSRITSGACGAFANWSFDSETGTLTISGWGSMYDHYESASEVPWYALRDEILTVVIEEGVTSISPFAFAECKQMTSVTIPESVTHIGHSAFFNCWSLLGVELPSGITEIDYDTFGFCLSMEYVTIPEGVTYIGFQAFAECMALDGLVLPETLEIIDSRAFHDCSSLTSLYIPASVEFIGEQAFLGCFSLPGFEVDPDNPVFCSYEGVLFNKDMTELIFCPAGRAGEYVVPAGVQTIGTEAFYECHQITSIVLPDGLLTISDNAFCDCDALTSIVIPESVSVIGDYAFCSCDSMQYIVFLGGMNFIFSEYVLESCPADMYICYTSDYADVWNPDGTTTEWYGHPLLLACRITYTGAYVGTDYVPYGWDATLPECHEEGMHFLFTCNGEPWWFGENVTEDVEVFVSTEPNVHALFFFINNELYLQTTCPFGEEIVLPEYVPEEGWYFSGWESDDGQSYEFMPDYDVWFYGYTSLTECTITIIYQYEDGTLIDEVSYFMAYGSEYNYPSPVIEGYSCYPGMVSGWLYEDTTVYVIYYPLPVHSLTIHYVDSAYYAEGELYEVCEPLVTTGYHGSYYSLVNPNVVGYTHDSPNEYGWLYEDTHLYVMYDPIAYELRVDYVFEDGSTAAPSHIEQVLYGHPYYVESPYVEGYSPDLPFIEGDMYYFGLCVTVTYSPLPCPIHVILMWADGTVFSEETYTYLYGEPYSIPLPEIEGYVPDPSVIAGITSGETWFFVYYNEIVNYTLTVHCLDKVYFSQGVIYEVCEPVVFTAAAGTDYTLDLPYVEGYASGMSYTSGTLDGDGDIYVMYTPNSYTLTIHFVYADGTPAFDDHVEHVLYGRPYYVDVPTLEYYYPDTNSVSGTMPAGDLEFTVVYNPVNIPGDVDGDGAFTFTDISALSLFLIGDGSIAEGVNADFNGDGEVNFLDLADMYIALIG